HASSIFRPSLPPDPLTPRRRSAFWPSPVRGARKRTPSNRGGDMKAIEAKTGQAYWRRIGLLWAMFGFFGLVMTATAKQPALGIFGLVTMVAPAWLLYRRRVCWLAGLDVDGATLLSGQRLPWSDFEKVVDVHAVRGGARWHNHYELVFRSGRA